MNDVVRRILAEGRKPSGVLCHGHSDLCDRKNRTARAVPLQGFSCASLFAMRQCYAFFSPEFTFVPQPVGQMPWGHVRGMVAEGRKPSGVLCRGNSATGDWKNRMACAVAFSVE
ncbi:MAG TPA: hypothetical protein PKD64_05945 [Pirellulaceae bacterium]|nr:hypothetical protein [Pirellulaceae bacterium]HMO91721.1 hypothetical protein [Pirellulaceae bacterium]HMP69816.1 hypothetical protein [Pirellulaceae bacterium]